MHSYFVAVKKCMRRNKPSQWLYVVICANSSLEMEYVLIEESPVGVAELLNSTQMQEGPYLQLNR